MLAIATACLFMAFFSKLRIPFKLVWLVGLILMFIGFYLMRSNNNIGTYYKNLFNIAHYIPISLERLYNTKLLKKHFYNNKIVRLKKH